MTVTRVEQVEDYSEQSSQNVGDVDYISGLPDSLLLHILSFMDMKDASKTSILSRRWRYVWTSTPNLIFGGPRILDRSYRYRAESRRRINNFFLFVDQSLTLYQGFKIQKFLISSAYTVDCMSRMDDWINFAMARKVEELKLEAMPDHNLIHRYEVPSWFFQYERLEVLKLRFVEVKVPAHVGMSSLKMLSLSKTRLNNNSLNKLMTGCPRLQDFSLLECHIEDHIHISSQTLQRLRLIPVRTSFYSPRDFQVDAPNLLSVNISGCVCEDTYCLKTSSCLQEARINIFTTNHCRIINDINHLTKFMQFIGGLSSAKVIRLSKPSIQVISAMAMKNLPDSALSCSCLIIETGLEKFELPGVARALRSSPGLGLLIINVNHYRDKFLFRHGLPNEFQEGFEIDEEVFLGNQSYPCLMNHVKTIKVTGMLRRNHIQQVHKNETLLQQWLRRELNLINFLLKHAMVLERMEIKITDKKYFQHLQQSEKIDSKLFTLPRASPNAEVLFSY